MTCPAAAAPPVERVTLLAKYEDHALNVIESHALTARNRDAGFYVEWTNEADFSKRLHLVEGATYKVKATLVSVEVQQFPGGWGTRSSKPYSTYFLRAESAVQVKVKK